MDKQAKIGQLDAQRLRAPSNDDRGRGMPRAQQWFAVQSAGLNAIVAIQPSARPRVDPSSHRARQLDGGSLLWRDLIG